MENAWISARTGLLLIFIVGLVTTEPCNEDIPLPRGLTVRSHNFNTVFSWKYDTFSPKPLFSVKMSYYLTGSSKYAQHCINITSMECDVSSLINNYEEHYILSVSATVGTNQSCNRHIKMSLPDQGVLDFPPVNMTADGRKVTVEFQRPDIMYKKKHSFLRKQDEFEYMIKYWEKAAENFVPTPSLFKCSRKQQRCEAKLLLPKENAEYCFVFEGKIFQMPINTSKEVCLTDPAKEDKSLAIILSGIILILIAVTVLTSLLVYKLLKSRTTVLPSSLLFFLKGIKPYNNIQKEETTCSSVQTAESPTSNQTLLHEEVGVDEMLDKGVASMENSRMKIGCSNVGTETEQISFLEIVKPENKPNVVFVDTGDELTNPDEDIRTISTMLESGSSTDSIQSNPIVSFGYDRPQVLVEMDFSDIVEGYKHTQLE
ncbi:interferon gamma receptor 1-like [Polypterus senegalus]|uniref:interferon gamma receptor 1-like n=1 Tax=Polypterus senegalus TaxID=55291 RepID=UPI0019623BAD|nr:interferon gamma receptor 1-like [Polypterus senegalus]